MWEGDRSGSRAEKIAPPIRKKGEKGLKKRAGEAPIEWKDKNQEKRRRRGRNCGNTREKFLRAQLMSAGGDSRRPPRKHNQQRSRGGAH